MINFFNSINKTVDKERSNNPIIKAAIPSKMGCTNIDNPRPIARINRPTNAPESSIRTTKI